VNRTPQEARRPHRLVARRRTTFAGLAVAGACVAGVLSAAGPSSAAPAAYAALGDSYTSGPLIPDQTLDPLGCLRSTHNYPHLTAAALGLALTDVSCSGATTADMTAPQSTDAGTNPAQLSAVTSADRVVTLGIGGNDIDFSGIIENCVALTPYGPTMVGLTCKSHYDAGGHDQIAAAIDALAPKVASVLGRIHQLAPHAKVFLVGYPAILPPTGTGCFPQMPLTTTDVPYLRAKELQLDAMLRTQAAHGGATYVDTYTGSVHHSSCTKESVRWVEPIIPDSAAFPVHPNARGEAALARFVEAAVTHAGV
jgi:lysophospholipase L1-like esterase